MPGPLSPLAPLPEAVTQAAVMATSLTAWQPQAVIQEFLDMTQQFLAIVGRDTLLGRADRKPDPFIPSLGNLYNRLLSGQRPPSPIESHANADPNATQTLHRRTSKGLLQRPLEDYEDLYYALLALTQEMHQTLCLRINNGFCTISSPIHEDGQSVAQVLDFLHGCWTLLNNPAVARALDGTIRAWRFKRLKGQLTRQFHDGQFTQEDYYELREDLEDPTAYPSITGLKFETMGRSAALINTELKQKYRKVFSAERKEKVRKERWGGKKRQLEKIEKKRSAELQKRMSGEKLNQERRISGERRDRERKIVARNKREAMLVAQRKKEEAQGLSQHQQDVQMQAQGASAFEVQSNRQEAPLPAQHQQDFQVQPHRHEELQMPSQHQDKFQLTATTYQTFEVQPHRQPEMQFQARGQKDFQMQSPRQEELQISFQCQDESQLPATTYQEFQLPTHRQEMQFQVQPQRQEAVQFPAQHQQGFQMQSQGQPELFQAPSQRMHEFQVQPQGYQGFQNPYQFQPEMQGQALGGGNTRAQLVSSYMQNLRNMASDGARRMVHGSNYYPTNTLYGGGKIPSGYADTSGQNTLFGNASAQGGLMGQSAQQVFFVGSQGGQGGYDTSRSQSVYSRGSTMNSHTSSNVQQGFYGSGQSQQGTYGGEKAEQGYTSPNAQHQHGYTSANAAPDSYSSPHPIGFSSPPNAQHSYSSPNTQHGYSSPPPQHGYGSTNTQRDVGEVKPSVENQNKANTQQSILFGSQLPDDCPEYQLPQTTYDLGSSQVSHANQGIFHNLPWKMSEPETPFYRGTRQVSHMSRLSTQNPADFETHHNRRGGGHALESETHFRRVAHQDSHFSRPSTSSQSDYETQQNVHGGSHAWESFANRRQGIYGIDQAPRDTSAYLAQQGFNMQALSRSSEAAQERGNGNGGECDDVEMDDDGGF